MMIRLLLCCALSLLSVALAAESESAVQRWKLPTDAKYENTKPLIGIMTQPCATCPGQSYIAAGFVKWIEAAGARPVPIRYYSSDDELRRLFKSINGLIFPGGLTWLWLDAPYVIAARKLFNMAVQANKEGDVFPIWGVCLGFQLLHILPSNISRNVLLVETDSVSHATTLDWTAEAKESHIFGGMNADLVDKIPDTNFNLTIENHEYGLLPALYEKYPILSEWYNILSTTKDRNGTVYTSTMEGKQMPFFGTQWHPEKPPNEFGIPEIPHTLDAIRISQHLSNVFVDTARYSAHKPESREEEMNMLIYRTPPVFCARDMETEEDNYDGPDIAYYFDPRENPPHGADDGHDAGPDDGDDNELKAADSYHQYMSMKGKSARSRVTRWPRNKLGQWL